MIKKILCCLLVTLSCGLLFCAHEYNKRKKVTRLDQYFYLFKTGNGLTRKTTALTIDHALKDIGHSLTVNYIFKQLGSPDIIKKNEAIYYFEKRAPFRFSPKMVIRFDENKYISSYCFSGFDNPGHLPIGQNKSLISMREKFKISCESFSNKEKLLRYEEACVISFYLSDRIKEYTKQRVIDLLGEPDIENLFHMIYTVHDDGEIIAYIDFSKSDNSHFYRVDLCCIPSESPTLLEEMQMGMEHK